MKRMHDKRYNYKLGIIAGKISDTTIYNQSFYKKIYLNDCNIPDIEVISLIRFKFPTQFGGTEFISECRPESLPSSINNGIYNCTASNTHTNGPATFTTDITLTFDRKDNSLIISGDIESYTTSMKTFNTGNLILDIVYF